MIDGEAIWIKLFHLTDILREMHDNSNCRADTPPLHTTLAQTKVMGTILWGPDEGCSIKEIAERLGYGNAFHFSGEFRRTFGISPQIFRVQERKKKISG